jgi:hypothetical protein
VSIKSSYSCLLILLSTVYISSVNASSWIEVGDLRLKNNLQLLNDSGATNISLTTWPIMWADVQRALNDIDSSELNAAQQVAYRELRFEMKQQTGHGIKRSVELVAGNSRPLLRSFGSFQKEKGEIRKNLEWDSENWSLGVRTNVKSVPGDEDVEVDWYGSYIARVLGGRDGSWVLGAGAVDQWWGAGSQSSLIMSNNSEPIPGIFFRTKQGQHFETPLLSWMGEWHFVSYVGQLESNRTIPEAKLTGMRFTFMPADGLEIGLSRSMQWGGEGRDQGFSTFWKAITTEGENKEGESGNQLAGIDIRYGFGLTEELGLAVHAQTIGEDEAQYLPSKKFYQFGFSLSQALSSGDYLNYDIEYSNTTADPFSLALPNVTYEHHLYTTGYRYRGRALGATYDNDAEAVSLGLSLQKSDGALWSARANYLNLNEDGVARGNVLSPTDNSLFMTEIFHQCFVAEGRLKLGLAYYSKTIDTQLVEAENLSASVSWEYRY